MSSGGSLGAMLVLLDMRPESVVDHCGEEGLRHAIANCLDCPTHAACARWLADPGRRPDSWLSFCPNAPKLQATRTRAPRRP
jgi:hypothetical protein